jgi:undecaprenyl-diphosphatase
MSNHRRLFASLLLIATVLVAGSSWAGDQPSDSQPGNRMSLTQAAVLGVVEGVTEYLPVSSTGHLLLAQRVMGIGAGSESEKEAADAYAICIQAGAIIAVLGLYFSRVRQMLLGLFGRNPLGLRLLVATIAGFLPAAAIGLVLNKTIKAYLFGPWPVVAAWLAGGVAILVVSAMRKGQSTAVGISLEQLSWKMALMIGFAQCIAMWPGVSRSLVTIVGGVLVGLSLPAAVEFSFLLGVVTLGAATCYDALKHGEVMLRTFPLEALLVGLLFAFASAVISIKWMVSYLNRHGLAVFGYYRVAVGLLTALLLTTGWI